MSNTALVLVDFQNDYFPGGRWELEGTRDAARQGLKLLTVFREQNLPIVHVRHEFPTDDAPFFAPGSDGAQIEASLVPDDGEPVVLKHHINSFRDTGLKQILDDLNVEKVVIVGAMSHMCIDAATRAANDFGFSCTVVHDACATHDLEFDGTTVPAALVHAAYMASLNGAYATVSSADELLGELNQSSSAGIQ